MPLITQWAHSAIPAHPLECMFGDSLACLSDLWQEAFYFPIFYSITSAKLCHFGL
jgi:hypothetical protein